MTALVALVVVTAVWGVTFVQVKDAVEVYPLFAFLTVRFAVASVTLAIPGARRLRSLGRRGFGAGLLLGFFLAAGYALQTAGLQRTTPSSAGFITGLYVVLVPLVALVLFREQIGRGVWFGAGLALTGLAMLSGVGAGSAVGDLLVFGCAAAFGFQIPLTGRFAPRYDALALTLVQLLAALVGFAAIAVALGELEVPHGWKIWSALLVTGVFASALAYLIQTWAQQRISASRTAIVYAMEPVFAGFFGYVLAGDRLGALGWGGCALILAGIIVSEPAAARALRSLLVGGPKSRVI